jgi:hypothetical protein
MHLAVISQNACTASRGFFGIIVSAGGLAALTCIVPEHNPGRESSLFQACAMDQVVAGAGDAASYLIQFFLLSLPGRILIQLAPDGSGAPFTPG